MNTKKTFAVIIFIMGFLFVSNAQPMPVKGSAETEALAQKLVNQCANIQEGEFVMISGGVRDLELLENIVINVGKLGAFPILTIGSDRMNRRWVTEVPEKYDSRVSESDLKMFGFVTAVINVDYSEAIGLFADIPPERFVTRAKANEPVNELIEKRNVKGVNLGNGLNPTEANAKQYGLSLKELSDLFWKGVNVDYLKLEATGKAVQTVLSGGKEVQITNPNGTDLKMRIEKRPVFVSDGVLSADDLKKGFAASQVYLPAGEAYLSPVPGTAEGTVVVDRQFYQGKEITGLTLNFKAGKLTSMTAKSGLEPLKKMYDAAGTGKDEFAFIDLGLNPNVSIKPGSKLVAWMPAGMVTIGVGNNVWAGGENKTPYSLASFLPGSTLKVDGKVLVENGVLKN
ncbi:MAG: aminopeptidase [Bacteroidota bacterium]|nr:aminopeptidase [Bacteroidota bacterium]